MSCLLVDGRLVTTWLITHEIDLRVDLLLGALLVESTDRTRALNQVLLTLVVHIWVHDDFLHWVCDPAENLLLLREGRRDAKRVLGLVRLLLSNRVLCLGAVPSGLLAIALRSLLLVTPERILLVSLASAHDLITLQALLVL